MENAYIERLNRTFGEDELDACSLTLVNDYEKYVMNFCTNKITSIHTWH